MPPYMAESQILSVIRVWAAIAWADGKLAEPEAEGLRRLIRSADLTDEEREASAKLLTAPVAMPDTFLSDLTEDARNGIYRAGCRIALVDHMFTQTERSMLDRLRALLGITEEHAKTIEGDVPGLM